ncbi:RNI superfamily protein [Medicago truncatula]|uniref:RNI superfamily protein n=1 Tax=Medicago truncatula TaxID=3880 RepID=G7JEL7_MEDTR|nr:RNI superfamily protein [Medicago truncatula]
MNGDKTMRCCLHALGTALHLERSYSTTSVGLQINRWLTDKNVKKFASVFPNLQRLDLSHCFDISEKGITQILRSCCEIRDLNLAYIPKMRLSRMNFEVPKLEVLNLSHTRVDDIALYAISKSCCGLLELLLENCEMITDEGVKHVLENCTQLKVINLRNCDKVLADVASMILSRPSLIKIIPPTPVALNSETIELCICSSVCA